MHTGVAPYRPNSLDGGCPFHAADGYVEVPFPVEAGPRGRLAPASYDDHFSQPRMFWRSMSPVEKEHIVAAYTFELSRVYEQAIKERQRRVLAQIDPVLCEEVAAGLGLPAPAASLIEGRPASPALSQVGEVWPTTGRIIGIVAGSDLDALRAVRRTILDDGMVPLVIAPTGGVLAGEGEPVTVQRTFAAARSVEFDAVLVAGAPAPGADAHGARDAKAGMSGPVDPRVVLLLNEAYRHGKPIGGWGRAGDAFAAASIPPGSPGVVVGVEPVAVLGEVTALLARHRVWDRFPATLA
uniref:catalase-related domain-containing protein n=1 Tax=Herbidospora sakaeratensis TaxID=564415 RepID=UPI000AB35944